MRQKFEEQDEAGATAKMWTEIEEQRGMKYPRQGTKPSIITKQPKSTNVEISAAATENNNMTWLDQMELMESDMETKLQNFEDGVKLMDARNDDWLAKVKRKYGVDGEDKLNEDEIWQTWQRLPMPSV